MSCDHNRTKFFVHLASERPIAEALGGAETAPKVLEMVFNVARNVSWPNAPSERAVQQQEAKAATLLLFAQMRLAGLTPPTHATSGLPRRDAQRGYLAIQQTLHAIEHRQTLPQMTYEILEQHTLTGRARHVLWAMSHVDVIARSPRLSDADRTVLSHACHYLLCLRSGSQVPLPIQDWYEARTKPEWEVAARTAAQAIRLLATKPDLPGRAPAAADPNQIPLGTAMVQPCGCRWERCARRAHEAPLAWFRLTTTCGDCANGQIPETRRGHSSIVQGTKRDGPQTWDEWAEANAHRLPDTHVDLDDLRRLMAMPATPSFEEWDQIRCVERALVFAGLLVVEHGGADPVYRRATRMGDG